MIATIKPCDAGADKGFMIVYTDSDGEIIDRVIVTSVAIEGEPWPQMELEPGNRLKVVRCDAAQENKTMIHDDYAEPDKMDPRDRISPGQILTDRQIEEELESRAERMRGGR